MSKYVVRQEASRQDYEFATRLCLEEGWHISPNDITHLYDSPPPFEPGSFVGELDGKRIGYVSAAKYGDDTNGLYYISLYMVDKPYRGRGYGLKIWNIMWETLDKKFNIYLDAVINMVPRYERMGLHTEWINKEYVLPVSKIIEVFAMIQSARDIVIKPLSEINFDKLFEYDNLVYGAPRKNFLKKWVTIPESLTWVATNDTGDILGYIVIRQSALNKQEMIIGPLFSDSIQIAQKILYAAAFAADSQRSAKTLRIFVPVCDDESPNAIQMIEKDLGIKSVNELARMYSKKPEGCLHKIIAINSPSFA